MSDTPAAPPRRRRSWLLIVSLCLNIALIPVIGAVIVRAMHRDVQIGSGGILAPRSLQTAIPSERAAIQKVIDAHTAKIRELRRAAVQTRIASFNVLAAPDYTPEKFVASLDAVRQADTALETESIAMMADSLKTLTPEERAAIVEKVRKRNRSWLYRMFKPRFD
ncbi:MAG: periplasmic heavy metal sensor [Alphaproteobacteria bacterium]|nr:periplasmic heavy metal sensor [Alphaproteobacteria bacterium]